MSKVDDLIAGFDAELKGQSARIDDAVDALRQRDRPLFVDVISLVETLFTRSVQYTREAFRLTIEPVKVDVGSRISDLVIRVEQEEVHYCSMPSFELSILCDEQSITVNGKKLSSAQQAAVLPIVAEVFKEHMTMSARRLANFGLDSDPIRIIARRQREGSRE